jgi:hypothetical protein
VNAVRVEKPSALSVGALPQFDSATALLMNSERPRMSRLRAAPVDGGIDS